MKIAAGDVSLGRLGLAGVLTSTLGAWQGFAPPAAAQTATGAPASGKAAFGETVEVQLVNVEVWVTDRQGNPVTGLGIDDFEVREDGKLVDISNFAEVRGPAAASRSAPEDPVAAPIDAPARQPALELERPREEGEEQRPVGFLALYFDELFSRPGGRQQLTRDLRTFFELRRVPPERVLILRQDQELEVEAHLGSGPAELEAALERLGTASGRGAQTWAEEKNGFREVMEAWEREVTVTSASGNPGFNRDPCDFFPAEAFRLIQYHIDTSRARIRETLEHLTAATGFLAGLPGPKTLIYVSDGLALTPGKDLMSLAKFLCQGRQEDLDLEYLEGMGEPFRRLSRHASANRVTIYTIQALGLRSNLTATSATERGVLRTTRSLSRYESESKTQQRMGMSYLADETGGRAVFHRGRFIEELEQIAEDMNGFYSLAYVPTHGGDGLEHRIDVEVRAPQDRGDQLRVRHRPGYRDKNQDQRMIERLQSALYLNLMDNPLRVRLGAGGITAGQKDRLSVPLYVRVPVDEITFLPQTGGDFASLRVAVLTRDQGSAKKTSLKQESYRLPRPEGSGPGLTVSLVVELDLEAGIHAIAFGVRDEVSQVASYVATGLDLRGAAP